MNYGDIIEYFDNTLDENFNKARKWSEEHNTTFEELMDRRDLPKRYFQIGQEPVPPTPPVPPPEPPQPEPTEDEKKASVRMVRRMMLQTTDYTQLNDVPFDDTEKQYYREYRQYLRDYTETENWWESNPMTYEEWSVGHHPVEETKEEEN